MKWHREFDYHGSRSYGAEQPPAKALALTVAWLAAVAKRKWRKLGERPVSSSVLLHDGQHSFSILGADSAKTAECPFPLKAEPADWRDWRVLP